MSSSLKKLHLSSEEKKEEDEIPNKFKCPITHEVMQEPVCIADGSVYELSAIKKWFKNKTTSPLTNLPLKHSQVCPNKEILEQIKASKWYKPVLPIPSFIRDSPYSFTPGQSGWFFVVYGDHEVYSTHADVVFGNGQITLIRNKDTGVNASSILDTYFYDKEKDYYKAMADLVPCYIFCLKPDHKHFDLIRRLIDMYKELDDILKETHGSTQIADSIDNVIISLLGFYPREIDNWLTNN